MNLGTYIKQPTEVLDYDLDYSEWLTTGDNVQSASVDVSPAGVVVEAVFVNDPRVKIILSGGVDATQYKVTVTMQSANGLVKQDEFKLKVKEI